MKEKIDHLKNLLIRLEDRSLRPGLKLPEGVQSRSDLTVAHAARQEIVEISDEAYIPAFKELLSKEKVTINRINLVTYLIRLADKHGNNDIADYVLSLVKKEKTRWINDVSLRELNQSTLQVQNEKEVLFDLANHKDWQIRFASLGLLSKLPQSYHVRVEDLCLKQIEKYPSKQHSLAALASTLYKVGSSKSLSSLKEIVRCAKKSDTISAALHAIDRINGFNELDFYLQTFTQKRDSSVKKFLISLIAKYGDNTQTELMIKRLKSILSRKRQVHWVYIEGTEPEIVTILKFLGRNSSSESKKILKWIADKKLDLLDETERDWVNERLKER